MNNDLIIYIEGEKRYKELADGMYIGLFHGTEGVERPETSDWGFRGPVIGPLKFAHTTYNHDVKIEFLSSVPYDKRQMCGFGEDEMIDFVDDCFPCLGNLYGDWTLFCIKDGKHVV